jgi:hypothetical protein
MAGWRGSAYPGQDFTFLFVLVPADTALGRWRLNVRTPTLALPLEGGGDLAAEIGRTVECSHLALAFPVGGETCGGTGAAGPLLPPFRGKAGMGV